MIDPYVLIALLVAGDPGAPMIAELEQRMDQHEQQELSTDACQTD